VELRGCRTLITGGSRGIGRAIALALAWKGGRIGINYVHNSDAAKRTAQEVHQLGGGAVVLAGDVACKEQAEGVVQQFVESVGGIDILVNNAGMPVPGSISTLTDEAWQRAIGVHLNGAFYCTRAAVPHMIEQRSGKIIVMSSVAALRGVPNGLAYCVVKSGLLAFTRCLAHDLADYGITVNALCPGLIETDFHGSISPEVWEHNIKDRVPMHRYGQPEEVADAALFLLRHDYITGEMIVIDGGLSMRITR
jgi:3-oxoacyl-[acyl-carrier protein] reductase